MKQQKLCRRPTKSTLYSRTDWNTSTYRFFLRAAAVWTAGASGAVFFCFRGLWCNRTDDVWFEAPCVFWCVRTEGAILGFPLRAAHRTLFFPPVGRCGAMYWYRFVLHTVCVVPLVAPLLSVCAVCGLQERDTAVLFVLFLYCVFSCR